MFVVSFPSKHGTPAFCRGCDFFFFHFFPPAFPGHFLISHTKHLFCKLKKKKPKMIKHFLNQLQHLSPRSKENFKKWTHTHSNNEVVTFSSNGREILVHKCVLPSIGRFSYSFECKHVEDNVAIDVCLNDTPIFFSEVLNVTGIVQTIKKGEILSFIVRDKKQTCDEITFQIHWVVVCEQKMVSE